MENYKQTKKDLRTDFLYVAIILVISLAAIYILIFFNPDKTDEIETAEQACGFAELQAFRNKYCGGKVEWDDCQSLLKGFDKCRELYLRGGLE